MVGAIAAMAEPPQMPVDFAIIEGVFDKEKYPHRLYKKRELFWAYAAAVILLQAEPFLLRKFFRKACLCVRKVPEHTCSGTSRGRKRLFTGQLQSAFVHTVIFLLFATWLHGSFDYFCI